VNGNSKKDEAQIENRRKRDLDQEETSTVFPKREGSDPKKGYLRLGMWTKNTKRKKKKMPVG